MERCPVCRAQFKREPVCYRCGADLSPLLAIEAEAALWERQAVALLKAGQPLEARWAAEQSLMLQHGLLAAAMQDFAHQELIANEARRLEWLLRYRETPDCAAAGHPHQAITADSHRFPESARSGNFS